MNAKLSLMIVVTLVSLALGSLGTSMARAESLLERLAGPNCGTPEPSCAATAPPACGTPAPSCCEPKITYNHVCVHRVRCCGCTPPIETVLVVNNPAACNPCTPDGAAIPVCLPSCCTGEPTVCGWVGLGGRGVVRYDYCCGLSIKIIFRNNGDIAVTYIGA